MRVSDDGVVLSQTELVNPCCKNKAESKLFVQVIAPVKRQRRWRAGKVVLFPPCKIVPKNFVVSSKLNGVLNPLMESKFMMRVV